MGYDKSRATCRRIGQRAEEKPAYIGWDRCSTGRDLSLVKHGVRHRIIPVLSGEWKIHLGYEIGWEGNYNRDLTSTETRELELRQRLTPLQAVRELFLHSRLPQPSSVQVHPLHSGFSVSCLPAMLIAVLCSHFMLSNGDLAIFNTENQRNRNSSLSRAPFSTASLILGKRVPQSLREQPGCSSRQEGASLGCPKPPLPAEMAQHSGWRRRAWLFPTLSLSHTPCWSEPGWC